MIDRHRSFRCDFSLFQVDQIGRPFLFVRLKFVQVLAISNAKCACSAAMCARSISLCLFVRKALAKCATVCRMHNDRDRGSITSLRFEHTNVALAMNKLCDRVYTFNKFTESSYPSQASKIKINKEQIDNRKQKKKLILTFICSTESKTKRERKKTN